MNSSRCLIFCLACTLLRRKALQTQVLPNQGQSRVNNFENFDRDVFVRVFEEDEDVDFDIPTPILDPDEEMEDADWSDVELPRVVIKGQALLLYWLSRNHP